MKEVFDAAAAAQRPARKRRTPSTAIAVGGTGGAGAGSLIEIIAAATGHPLPPGAGSAITGVLGMLLAYFAPGGRKGDAR